MPFVEELHKDGRKLRLMMSPELVVDKSYGYYSRAEAEGSLVQRHRSGAGPYVGSMFGKQVAYVDFFHPAAAALWNDGLSALYAITRFNGLDLHFNVPINLDNLERGPGTDWQHELPFNPLGEGQRLEQYSLDMDAQNHLPQGANDSSFYEHFNVHSLYATKQAERTMASMRSFSEKLPFVTSTGSFSGKGRATAKMLTDSQMSWEDVSFSIARIFAFQMFGFAMTGENICSDWYESSQSELCFRWYQQGAFAPFAFAWGNGRNTNKEPYEL